MAADGRNHAGGHRRLWLPAGLRAAGGRLSDDPGPDVLPRGESGRDDIVRDVTAGTTAGGDAWAQSDDVGQFSWRFCHHTAVQPRFEPGYCRTGSTGGDQRSWESVAIRSAGASDLCQGEPG